MLELHWMGEEASIKKCDVHAGKKCTPTPSPKLSIQTKLLLGPGTYANAETGTRTHFATNAPMGFGVPTAKHVQVVPESINARATANATLASMGTVTAIAIFQKTTLGCWHRLRDGMPRKLFIPTQTVRMLPVSNVLLNTGGTNVKNATGWNKATAVVAFHCHNCKMCFNRTLLNCTRPTNLSPFVTVAFVTLRAVGVGGATGDAREMVDAVAGPTASSRAIVGTHWTMSALETIGLQQINKKIPKPVLHTDVATTTA